MGVWDVDPGVEMEEVGVSEVIFSCGDDMRAIQNQLMEDVELWRVQSREGRMRSGKLSRLSMWGNEPSCHTPGYPCKAWHDYERSSWLFQGCIGFQWQWPC